MPFGIPGLHLDLWINALYFSPELLLFLHLFLHVLHKMTASRIPNLAHAPNFSIPEYSLFQTIHHGLAIAFSPANSSLDLRQKLMYYSGRDRIWPTYCGLIWPHLFFDSKGNFNYAPHKKSDFLPHLFENLEPFGAWGIIQVFFHRVV